MEYIIETVKLVGGFAGLTTLGVKIIEELSGFLKIKVQVNQINNCSVLTEIENTGKLFSKKIKNAFLIISPEHSDLIETGQIIANELGLQIIIDRTNKFENFQSTQPIYFNNNTIAFIPLPYYYSENIAIGDEVLTYSCSIENTRLMVGNYSVRFFICGENRYHRSTQTLLII